MPRTTINSWHAAYMAVERAHGGYGSSLLSLIVKRCAAWQAWMCLSHPWQWRSGHHQNHMEELTSEPTESQCVVAVTSDLDGGTRNRRGSKFVSGLEGRRRSARAEIGPSSKRSNKTGYRTTL